ncbi:MAG: CaiB/BaiF CoA-transferase family protein [Rhodothermales bacterium]|nr:CaiB/BaiF CoA-transferase family protein [Rhodothermales bacterium]
MPGPLAALRVLDFTTLLPGPFATLTLADLGADVVRVEAPHRPDLMRFAPPFDGGGSVGHALVNRNKRSLALDLKHPEAAAVVKRLVRRYDVVVEAFRPGVMDRLGVGYDALKAANPRLIYGSLTGYGQTGPFRDRAGHDVNYLALSGLMSHTGADATGPAHSAQPLGDTAGALAFVAALLAAVVHRERTGEGQHVDVAILDSCLYFGAYAAAASLAGSETLGHETSLLGGGSAYGYYRTADDRYLAVGALEPKFWAGFCAAVGRPDLEAQGHVLDPAAQAGLRAEVQREIARKPLSEWQAVFAEHDVCVEPVLTVGEAAEHPQVRARQMTAAVPRPDGEPQRQAASPFRFSGTAPAYRHTGPALGAHTKGVLREAGFSAEEVAALETGGAFG